MYLVSTDVLSRREGDVKALISMLLKCGLRILLEFLLPVSSVVVSDQIVYLSAGLTEGLSLSSHFVD